TALDGSTVWGVGSYGYTEKTTNAGATWIEHFAPTQNNLNDVTFVDSLNGWAVGNAGTIVHTTDGGITWALQTSGTSNNLYGIASVAPSPEPNSLALLCIGAAALMRRKSAR